MANGEVREFPPYINVHHMKEPEHNEALATWQKFRDLSIVKYKSIYDRLGMQFDVYSGESQFQEKMLEALKLLEEKKMLEELDGASVISLGKYKLGKCMVKKQNGSTLYITRDIAAAISRYQEYKFEEMIYVVAAPQAHHFKQLFKVLELMGFDWAKKCKHVDFGLVKGMSTRKGEVKFLEEILDEAKRANYEIMAKNEEKFKLISDPEGVSDVVGLSAVFIQDLKAKRVKDYEFSWDRMLAEHGDTGPYIQYAHVRLASIERKCSDVPLTSEVDFSLLAEPVAQDLAYLLSDFPIVINAAKLTLEPSGVVTYALKICRLFSSGVDQLKVKGSPLPLAQARLLLFSCTRVVLNSCLRLLGLTPLERM
jgi:arginyl-tRNA synthetase